MRLLKPNVEPAQAERWAREIYGIEATAAPLAGEIDRNFLLSLADGSRRVLKIAPDGSDRVAIEGQLAAMRHLRGSDVGGLVPEVARDPGGETLTEVRAEGGETLLVRMVGYIEGTPLARKGGAGTGLLREIGRTLGQVDRAFESFEHPGSRRELVWDLARLSKLNPLLDSVSQDLRPSVGSGLERFARRVEPRLDELPRSVIHNDANDHNLLVTTGEDGHDKLCGLIDFGDMVHSVTVAEPAICCAYAMLDTEDPWSVARELTSGYEQTRPLDELETELLPDLIVGRLCASLLMSAQARLDAPDDEYLTISERPVADLLKRLSEST